MQVEIVGDGTRWDDIRCVLLSGGLCVAAATMLMLHDCISVPNNASASGTLKASLS